MVLGLAILFSTFLTKFCGGYNKNTTKLSLLHTQMTQNILRNFTKQDYMSWCGAIPFGSNPPLISEIGSLTAIISNPDFASDSLSILIYNSENLAQSWYIDLKITRESLRELNLSEESINDLFVYHAKTVFKDTLRNISSVNQLQLLKCIQ